MPKIAKTGISESHVVTEDRFKLLPVTSRMSIRDFSSSNGLTFAPGRGFYQLTKPETIQAYKEIVAVRVSDGAQVSGDAVRDLLKIPSDAVKFKYKQVPDFEVFVQSTSYNRVLMPDTKFLYEANPDVRGTPKKGKGTQKVTHGEKRNAAAPTHCAGSPIDLVFSFDTTGSMYSCLGEVRKNLETMINRILTDIPNIRIAVFGQGDYCDFHSTYATKYIDFTTDKKKLVEFVKKVEATGGGDFEECYELVLQEARTKLSWQPGSQRAMVMIGDAIPHTVADYKNIMRSYTFVKEAVDWRKEADELVGMGCRVYAVQAGGGYQDSQCAKFWQGLAYKTYGHHLSMSSFNNVFDFIMAIAYKEQGPEQLEAYKQEVIKRGGSSGGGLNSDLHALFSSLGEDAEDDDDDDAPGPSGGAAAVSSLFSTPSTGGAKKRGAPKASAGAAKKAKTEPKKATATKRKASAAPTIAAKKSKTTIAAKKPTAKKPAAKKTPAKKTPAKKTPAKKTPAKKTPAKKTPAKKTPAKKTPAKKTPAKKAPAKKAPAKKAPAKKAPAKKAPAKKAPASKAPTKKAPAKKASAKRGAKK